MLQAAGATLLSGAIAAPMIALPRKALAAGSLVVVTWGGRYRQVAEEAWFRPFEKEFGIRVIASDTPDLAKVKAQVMTNNVQWDVFDATGVQIITGSRDGFWEPIDPTLFKTDDLIRPLTKYSVPYSGSVGGIAWDNNKFPDGQHPETFAEYFDFEKFPGPRTLRNRAFEMMEIALLADGVPQDKLYPLDIDRAFRSLKRIKPYISNWVEQTPQTVTLLATGQVNFTYTYPSPLLAGQNAAKSLRFSYKQNLSSFNYLVVLKNAPNKAAAMKYLQFVTRPDRQAAFANAYIGIPPVSRSAYPMLSAEARQWLPDVNSKTSVPLDEAWWGDNYDEVTTRFKEWLLS
ncbi:ABC transporter substrate-binding protein [Bradyrhizobium hipponense]|uniref:ABC transporter substrate-binding protein n=1 Tax=Bradyrhizobium hipponense TaxID=2605638 RepID=UPI001AEEFCFA|nr:ABC transporter substrate-binding protein [Bradyrhizobium hipponense]